MAGQGERVPDVFAVDDFCGGRGDDAEETETELDERQEENLPVDTVFALQVAGEIGDVGCHGGPAAGDGGEG